MTRDGRLKKRFFSFILMITVVLSMMPAMAWADLDGIAVQTVSDTQTESSVAEVAIQGGSTKYYENIRDAFTAADVEGQTATVKLLQDVKLNNDSIEGIHLQNGGIITLDLNGFTLSQKEQSNTQAYSATIVLDAYSDSSAAKKDSAFLTIDDTSASKNGAVIQPNNAAAVYNDSGELTVKNGAIKTINNDAYALFTLGKTDIQGGTIGAEGRNGLQTYPSVNVQLSGGTYSSINGSKKSLDSMLAGGHTFKYADNSGYPDLSQSSVNQAVTVVPGSPGISYKDADGNSQIKGSTEFTYLTSPGAEDPITLKAGWYAAKGDITINGNVTAEDGVNLILCDNANLMVSGQMLLSGGLTVYGQGGDTGKMTVTAGDNPAFAASGSSIGSTASVRLYGGKLTATGRNAAFDDNVSLANVAQDAVKCIITGSNPEQAADVHQNASVTISKCTAHKWNYTPNPASRQHVKTCTLCSYNPKGENAAEECIYNKFTSMGAEGHKKTCICGNTDGENIPHTSTKYTINDDGLTHSGTCDDCKAVLSNEKHQFGENGQCACGATLKASYNNEHYANLQAAVDAAGNNSGTVIIANEGYFIYQKIKTQVGQSLTINLNGGVLTSPDVREGNEGVLTIYGGNVTLRNGRVYGANDTNAMNAIVIAGGELTLGEGVIADGGAYNIKEIQTLYAAIKVIDSTAVLNLNTGNVLIHGLEVPDGKVLADYLPEGCAFAKCDGSGDLTNSENPEIVNAYTNTDGTACTRLIENLKVIEHTHSFTENNGYACACGFVCHHADLDSTFKCTVCSTQMTVKITKDGQDSYAESLAAAISTAKSGSTLTLLVDNIPASSAITGGKELTLDFNGKSLQANGSVIEVGASDTAAAGSTGNTLTITGASEDSYQGNSITVYGGNRFYTDNWSGMLNVFTANKNVTGSINSGTFRTFKGNDVKWSALIAADHAFYNLAGTSFVYRYSDTISSNIGNTKVIACTHPLVERGYCVRCHKGPYIAEVSGKYYETLAEAIEAANGGTIKLLANVSRSSLEIQGSFTLDLNGYNLVCNLAITSGTPKLINSAGTGGTISKLTISGDAKLSDLLSEEWAFKINDAWAAEEQLAGKTATSVNVVQAPITRVWVESPSTEAEYGSSNLNLIGNYALSTGVTTYGKLCKIERENTEDVPSTSRLCYTLPAELPVGTHTYRFTVSTSDGYSKSCDFILTVKPANLANADVKIVAEPTYNGTAQQPEIEVKMGEKTLVEGKDYVIKSAPITACTLEYEATLILEGIGNYTGYNTTATWQMKPATLTYTVTASPKKYDGTDKADVQVNFNYEENWIHLNEDDYTVTANYENETAGENKEINGTVKLKYPQIAIPTTRNYILADESFSTAGSISKNTATNPQPVSLTITNGVEKTYEVELPALPALGEGCGYGGTKYSAVVDFGSNTGYYESGVAVENGILILPIKANATDFTGEIGTVNVTVETANYENITLTVNVSAANKITPQPDGELMLSTKEITYGDKLSSIQISGKMQDGDTPVDGTFAWQNPEDKPDADDAYAAKWIFTPKNLEKYEEVTGTASIVVKQAKTTGEPKYEKIFAGNKTLADAKLRTEDGTFSVPGTVAWTLGSDTKVEQGKAYEWIFTPADSVNYETIRGTIILWAKTFSGGSSITASSSEVKTDDKTSQTGEKEKATTSPSEVKNETRTDAGGNTVTIANVTVSAANQKEILKQAKDNKSSEIIIKVSEKDVKDGAKLEVSLDKSFIEDILNNTDANLTIQAPDGEKTFTQEELKKLAETAADGTIVLTQDDLKADETPQGGLTPMQKKIVKGVRGTSLKLKTARTKDGSILLTWTKSKGYKVDRFEIYRSTKKNSGYGKKAFFTTKNGNVSKYLNTKDLKKNKTYYYKVRGVRTIDGKDYYTKWSNKACRTVKKGNK